MALIIGTNQADDLVGLDGETNAIYGLQGGDTLTGGDLGDLVRGGLGDDLVNGADGDDLVGGGKGNDTVLGGNGADIVGGGKGDDTIIGGVDADVLVGGSGADVFTWAAGDSGLTKFTRDIVRDFEQGSDLFDAGGAAWSSQIIGLNTFLAFDFDGDSAIDSTVKIKGAFEITEADFLAPPAV